VGRRPSQGVDGAGAGVDRARGGNVSRAEVESAIRQVLETVLRRTIAPGEDVQRQKESTWDSLKHVELIFSVEEALDIQFDAEELDRLDSYRKLVDAAAVRLRAGI
jgi:acyl carrier protein